MPNIQFGTGTAAFVPSSINSPLLTNLTPLVPTALQEISFDFKASNKELYGRYQFALDVARGKVSATGKGKIPATDPLLLNALYWGMPQQVGCLRPVTETHAVGATVSVSNAAHFSRDYGVVNAATGVSLQLIASGTPAAGQYTVNSTTGVYTFAAGETITSVNITYQYADSTNGTTITLSSQPQGYGPEFELNLFNSYEGKLFSLDLYRCKMTDFSLPTKQEDYWIADFSFSVCANAAGNIGAIYADQ